VGANPGGFNGVVVRSAINSAAASSAAGGAALLSRVYNGGAHFSRIFSLRRRWRCHRLSKGRRLQLFCVVALVADVCMVECRSNQLILTFLFSLICYGQFGKELAIANSCPSARCNFPSLRLQNRHHLHFLRVSFLFIVWLEKSQKEIHCLVGEKSKGKQIERKVVKKF